ncbi:ISAs1 family transposase [Photobacterium sp. TY1-4]|uniref:ISAs1 family transposase n=1 Tax=Photobacterium sp. TY1-4 TaxID=2899122 RepID=UPI0021C13537|nr:ISAs1 family transposase [Photobacterium sp. TY1-4]UXI04095.1 ISAs1 family transposase [Photobacterium sp. TY1-4]
MNIDTIKEHFSIIRDERQSAKVDYPLFDILFGSICAVIAGGQGWTDIREYVLGHHDWFLKRSLFEKGVPVDDTFARLIASIDPAEFRDCFLAWMKAVHKLTCGEVVAIDGKTLRGSYDRDDKRSAIHMVSAYASANQLVLGQLKTDNKSNEIIAIPALIKMLDLRGAIVTVDAMACQTKIAKAITSKGGDYLLAVKGNQGNLAAAVQAAFTPYRRAPLDKTTCQIEKQKGRVEARTCHVLNARELEGDFSTWSGLTSIVMVENYRAAKGKEPELEYRYYISSAELTPEQAGNAIRAHWGIESMHWILDVSMREDACQIYRENAAENLAGLRHMALNMLRAEPTKISVPMKQKRCMMKPAFLEQVLVAGFKSMAKP